MTTTSLDQSLAAVVGAENRAKPQQLPQFSVDGLTPKGVVFPGSADEVSRVMKLASSQGLAVVPRGSGTAMSLGSRPERVDVVLGTRRMDRIVAHEAADLTVTVEAGITLQALNDVLAPHGQCVPLDAPLPERATIGGVLAVNTTGPRRLGFGGPRDRLIGIRVVDAQGTAFKGGGKVVKNVAGYDLNKMMVGSLGTLGIIVEATFKLAPAPRARATMIGAFMKLEEAMAAAEAVRASWCRPLALDLVNKSAYDLAATRAGVPTLSDRSYMLAADLGGGTAAVQRQQNDIHRIVVDGGGKSLLVDESSASQAFWQALIDTGRREQFPASMVTRCSVLFSQVIPQLHGHEAMAEGGRLEAGIDVHLASGTVRCFWWGEQRGVASPTLLADTARTLRTAAGHVNGSFVIESCPVFMKGKLDVWGPMGQDLAIMKRLKELFDPARTLNPGRFVGGI